MIKIALAIAVLGSVGGFAGLAMAQGGQGEAVGSEISSQCAHRRVMAPDPHNDCVRRLRSDGQLGYGRGYGQGLGYWQGQLGYGQGQPGYGQGQAGYGQDQPGYGQGGANQQSDQPDEEQPKVRRERPKSSTSPKVATASAPKPKKAPPRLDTQKEQQLYQQFLEWRNRRLFFE